MITALAALALFAADDLRIDDYQRPFRDAFTGYSGYISKTERAYYDGDYVTAAARYKSILKGSNLSDHKKIGNIGAGWSLIGQGKNESALSYFKQADIISHTGEPKVMVLIGRGIAHFNLRNYPEAYRDFSNCADNYSEYREVLGDAYYFAGLAALENGDSKNASSYFDKLIKTFPDHERITDAYVYTGMAYLEQKQTDKAISTLEAFIQKYPTHPKVADVKLALAEAYADKGDYRGAIGEIENLLNSYPYIKEQAQEALKRLNTKYGDRIVADTSFRFTHPMMVDFFLYKPASYYYEKGQLDKAMPRFMRLANDFPADNRSAKGLALVGQAFFDQRSYQKAVEVFGSYIMRYSNGADLPVVMSLQAQSYLGLKDYTNALKTFDELAYRFPEEDAAKKARAKMKAILKQSPKAAEGYAFKTPGFEQNAAFDAAIAAYENKDYRGASGLFLEFAQKYPADKLAEKALFNAGYILYQGKIYEDAVSRLSLYLEKYPTGVHAEDAHYCRGESYYRLGEYESTLAALKQFPEAYPASQYKPHAYKIMGLAAYELSSGGNDQYRELACQYFDRAANVYRAQGNPGEAEKLEETLGQLGCK